MAVRASRIDGRYSNDATLDIYFLDRKARKIDHHVSVGVGEEEYLLLVMSLSNASDSPMRLFTKLLFRKENWLEKCVNFLSSNTIGGMGDCCGYMLSSDELEIEIFLKGEKIFPEDQHNQVIEAHRGLMWKFKFKNLDIAEAYMRNYGDSIGFVGGHNVFYGVRIKPILDKIEAYREYKRQESTKADR